eukprot:CAMPEP_0183307720 /NCGR_PEP_ID=MMETSP0160_2-20130417/18947_1 /TAXON_ID=2839 ORGANISM="Odontella Sinensis, Strain Grunow 1884" /NCGR_SAMPLE_ID=MMETSP0160_2 /ASSEMBLY_ACC=CAM_ASM_000250 /LENGTH=333 /DNA_ID=CAMNT_0025471371 /DNA_START=62 /DNA_END=1063 /DNA_ORIENTATION=+
MAPVDPNTSVTRKRRRGSMQIQAIACTWLIAASSLSLVCAFHMDMVASPRKTSLMARTVMASTSVVEPAPTRLAPFPATRNIRKNPNVVGGGGVTSSLISQLAVVALKLRLAAQSGVKCDVTGAASDLILKGEVGPVTVRGRGWESPLGLTCRAIEATVRKCHLDMGSVVSRRKLVLTTPALGDAMIAMNGADFANFITHPLMRPPSLLAEPLQFIKEGVVIDAGDGGAVTFFARHKGKQYKCFLMRDTSRTATTTAKVDVVPVESEEAGDIEQISIELGEVLSDYFNQLTVELDGTFLSYRDMMVTAKGGSPSVMLALSIRVKKFPSPGLAF